MRKTVIVLLLISVIILLVGCSNETTTDDMYKESNEMKTTEYVRIDQSKAYEMMQTEDVIILDVRTKEEFDTGHIVDANLLPVDEIGSSIETLFPDKEAVYLVYCRSGNRSKTATEYMLDLGYSKVFDFGGINTWEYDIEK